MGQPNWMILLFLLHVRIGLAQDASSHEGLTTSNLLNHEGLTTSNLLNQDDKAISKLLKSQTITGFGELINEFTDAHSNLSNIHNSTSNSNNILTTLSVNLQQHNNTTVSKIPNIAEVKSNSKNAPNSSAAARTINSNSTKHFSIRTVNAGLNSSKSSTESPNTSMTKSTVIGSNESTITDKLKDHFSSTGIDRKSIAGNMFNDLKRKMVDVTGSDAVHLALTDKAEQSFLKNSSSINDLISTEQTMHNGSFIPGEASGSRPWSTNVDNNIQQTKDFANVSDGMETPIDANKTAENITLEDSNTLPRKKWQPGMKQPQTISDLIRITGADINFITSQFGSIMNEKRNNISNMSGLEVNKAANISEENGTATNNGKDSHIKDVDKLIDKTTMEDFGTASSKVETTSTNINELTPGTTKGIFQDGGFINPKDFQSQTPQLRTLRGDSETTVSKRNVIQGIDNSVNADIVKVISTPQIVSETANDFVPKGKFNTQEPVRTIVVVKQPGNVTSPRRDGILNSGSRKLTSSDASSPSSNFEFRRNGETVIPGTRREGMPRSSFGQTEMDSRRLISFGNNPQYTIGTGSSVQIPRVIDRNRLTNVESTGGSINFQINQGLFRRRLSEPGISDVSSRMDRTASGERFDLGTTSPFLRDVSTFGTGGLSSRAPIGSRDSERSGIFRISGPIPENFGDNSGRNSISGGQGFEARISLRGIDSDLRSVTNEAPVYVIPYARGPENLVSVTGSMRDNLATLSGLGDIIPRETRQSADIVTRSDISRDLSRQQSFGGGISSTGFGSSVSRPSELGRNIGFRRDSLRTRDFSDRIIPRAVSFERSISRDGSHVSVPIRGNALTTGAFGIGGMNGIRAPVFATGGIMETLIRPTDISRGSMYRPPDIFAPSPRYFIRDF